MMGLHDLGPTDPWAEPTEDDFETVDTDLVMFLMHEELRGSFNPCTAPDQYGQLREMIRWFIAFEIEDWTTRKRRWVQHCVAEEHDVTLEAVQTKVRDLYAAQSGRQTAQELFEEDLERIHDRYQERVNLC